MLTAIGIVPATPLLVPELGGAAAGELAALREHTVAVAAGLADRCDRWTVLGVQGARETPAARSLAGSPVGSFAGFGVDVRVSLDGAPAPAVTDAAMPLPLLIAGWLRGAVGAGCAVAAELVDGAADPSDCAAAGRALAGQLAGSPLREGVLVVADGPTTLTAKAPGAFDPRAAGLDAALRAAFAAGDLSCLAALDEVLCAELGVEGRAPWQVLAGVVGDGAVRDAVVFADAPYGVGYYACLWLPAGEDSTGVLA
ncbi:hypothetical protein [Tomitella biformata]|uniref:hypothetical protein n=1 Tax=Tomitella biformata TaxID=630403 RepID=UPI000466EE41|nr:hypothetical protein [Tomitella biformata]